MNNLRIIGLLWLLTVPAIAQDENWFNLASAGVAASGSSCTTVTDTTIGRTSSGQASIGQTATITYVAATFIITNAADAGSVPCKVDLVLKKTATPSFTIQVAVYTNAHIPTTASAGSINGSFSSSFNVSALTTLVTTNTFLLNATSPMPAVGTTNSIVIKCIGSPNDFTNFIGIDMVTGTQGYVLMSSTDGITWDATYSIATQARFNLYK